MVDRVARSVASKRVTRDVWLERVKAWQASGLDAAAFVKGKRFSTKALRWWAWKLASWPPDQLTLFA